MANLVSRRELTTMTKITSKKNVPEIITFRYTSNQSEDEMQEKDKKSNTKNLKAKPSIDCDKLYLPDAGDAIKNVKTLLAKALNMYDMTNDT